MEKYLTRNDDETSINNKNDILKSNTA